MGGPAQDAKPAIGAGASSGWARGLAAFLALAGLAWAGSQTRIETSIDFYQFWGVGAARAAEATLAPPYGDRRATRAVLDRHFAAASDPASREVHAVRREAFEPFGSPLLYALFAVLPTEYPVALGGFRAAQLVAFGLGVFALLRMCGLGIAIAGLGVALLAVAYRPFGDDLFTGNLNAVQLGLLVLAIGWVGRAGRVSSVASLCGASTLLVALALLKLNLAPAVALLGIALALRAGTGRTGVVIASAAGSALLLVGASSLYFGSARVWLDWWSYAFGDPRRLGDYAVATGNASTPRLLAETLGIDPLATTAFIAAVLALSFFAVAVVRARAKGATSLTSLARLLEDPWRAASLGVLAALALLPLVWFHYFVLALVPIGFLARAPGAPRAIAVAALLFDSAVYLPLAVDAGLYSSLTRVFAVAWLLPWAGLLFDASPRNAR